MTHKFVNFNQGKNLTQRGARPHWRSKHWRGRATDAMGRAGHCRARSGRAVDTRCLAGCGRAGRLASAAGRGGADGRRARLGGARPGWLARGEWGAGVVGAWAVGGGAQKSGESGEE
jgi:hypothetical protein